MSVNAYKIIEIKTVSKPSFNPFWDERIFRLANNPDLFANCGILTFQKVALQNTLVSAQNKIPKDKKEQEKFIQLLQNLILDCGDNKEVQYCCY